MFTQVSTLIPGIEQLLPEGFQLQSEYDFRYSLSLPAEGIKHIGVERQGSKVIGRYQLAVTGPLALFASISRFMGFDCVNIEYPGTPAALGICSILG